MWVSAKSLFSTFASSLANVFRRLKPRPDLFMSSKCNREKRLNIQPQLVHFAQNKLALCGIKPLFPYKGIPLGSKPRRNVKLILSMNVRPACLAANVCADVQKLGFSRNAQILTFGIAFPGRFGPHCWTRNTMQQNCETHKAFGRPVSCVFPSSLRPANNLGR